MEENKKERKSMNKGLKIALIILGAFFAFNFIVVSGFVIYSAATELKVNNVENIQVIGTSSKTLKTTDTFKVMSWNVGYCALDEEADFFLDGGKSVRAPSLAKVQENAEAIKNEIVTQNPDVIFMQEVDSKSSRSFKFNEVDYFMTGLNSSTYKASYALNYKAGYVPYPMPPLGKVQSGILSLTKFDVSEATRYQLPISFSWPLSMLNLKRCLLVSRVPLQDSTKELVLINLHLEAYDEGAGKIAQTKMLRDFIEAEYEKGNYVIAGGDFNQSFSEADLTKYPTYGANWKAPIIDQSTFTHSTFYSDSSVPSCRLLNQPYKGADTSTFQYYMLDGFICSNNLTVTVETLQRNFKNTDHNPVMLNVQFN